MPIGSVGLALVTAFIVTYFRKKTKEISEKIFCFLITAVSSFLVLILTVGNLIVIFAPYTQKQVDSLKLIAVNDASTITGSFWLGSGSIKERNYYYFYYQRDDGGIKQRHVPVDRSVIYEDENLTNEGELKIFKSVLEKPWDYWSVSESNHRYNLHVPVGTVIRQLELDLR